jgi:hypothetical protein
VRCLLRSDLLNSLDMNWVYMLLLCLAEVCNFGLSVPALAPPSRGATGMKSSPSQDICRKRTCGRSKICVVNSNAREICVCAPCSGTTSKKHTVCGNDGQTYSSKCSLQYQRCISRNKTLKQAHRGKCRGIVHKLHSRYCTCMVSRLCAYL